jgi:hypothetical protein
MNSSDYNYTLCRYEQRYGPLAGHLPEIIGVESGLRDATLVTVRPEVFREKFAFCEAFCEARGLFIQHYKKYNEDKILIAREPLPLPAENRHQNLDNRFGYPNCCIRYNNKRDRLATPQKERRVIEQGDRFDFRMNPFLKRSPFHLYKHWACSLTCKATLKKSSQLLEKIEVIDPDLAEQIHHFNQLTAFYTDIGGIAILLPGLSETVKGLRYDSPFVADKGTLKALQFSLSEHNLDSDYMGYRQLFDALSEGHTLVLQDDHVLIADDSGESQRIPRPQHLTWKLVAFQ